MDRRASIVSGAVIERIRSFAFWIFAILIGSVTWSIDAAWGWHYNGWMVELLGYHDAYASGVIHAIAGGTALGILCVLGPRLGKFAADGTPHDIAPHNTWLVCIGLFLIYTGFWGFYVACNVPIIDAGTIGGQITGTTLTATTIYLTPTTLGAITVNFLMSLSGGMLVGYMASKGGAFWTYSGGLAGIITASAGNDLYHPIQALIIGGIGTYLMYKMHFWVERKFKIDDAVGAVAVHGYAGWIGVVIAGFVLWGHPSSPYEGFAPITPWGQFFGAMIMFWGLGFIPAWIVAKILSGMDLLRIPLQVELLGLDFHSNREADQAPPGRGRGRPRSPRLSPPGGSHRQERDHVNDTDRHLGRRPGRCHGHLSVGRLRSRHGLDRHHSLAALARLAGQARECHLPRQGGEIRRQGNHRQGACRSLEGQDRDSTPWGAGQTARRPIFFRLSIHDRRSEG